MVVREKKTETRRRERAKEKRVLFLRNSLLSENFSPGCKERFLQSGSLFPSIKGSTYRFLLPYYKISPSFYPSLQRDSYRRIKSKWRELFLVRDDDFVAFLVDDMGDLSQPLILFDKTPPDDAVDPFI